MRELAPGSRREPRVSLVFYFRDGAKIVEPQVATRSSSGGPGPRTSSSTTRASRARMRGSSSRPTAASASRTSARRTARDSTACRSPRGRIAPGDELRVGDVTVALHVLSIVAGVQGMLGYDTLPRASSTTSSSARGRSAAPLRSLMVARARARVTRFGRGRPRSSRSCGPSIALPSTRPMPCSSRCPRRRAPTPRRSARRSSAATPRCASASATFPDRRHDASTSSLDAARTAMVRGPISAPPPSGAPASRHRRAMRAVWDMVDRVAPSILPVLVLGETGTGKEVVARALHAAERTRRRGRCAASTARRSRRTCSRASCSATRRARSPAPTAATKRPLRAGARRHALPRRDRRAAAGAQAALLRVLETKQVDPRRRRPTRSRSTCASSRRRTAISRTMCARGHVPRRPLLPAARRDRSRVPAAARARATRSLRSPRRFLRDARARQRTRGRARSTRRRWPRSCAGTGRATCAS